MTSSSPELAALEALDAKVGKLHTRDDSHRVYLKWLENPAAITDADLTIVRYFHGEKHAAEYAALRAKALAPPPPPATATTNASGAAPRLKVWQKYTTPEAYQKAFTEAYERFKRDVKTVTKDDWQLLGQKVMAFEHHSLENCVLAINEKNKERNARIAALEVHNKSLEQRCQLFEARILELEASAAARQVDHVDR